MEIRIDREVADALEVLALQHVRLGEAELAAMDAAEECAAEECELDQGCPAEELCDDLRARAGLMRGDARCPGRCQRAVRLIDGAIVRAARGL